MSDKYFERGEAEELLPFIAQRLAQARAFKQEIDTLDAALARTMARIMVLGGSIPPLTELSERKWAREQLVGQLQEAVSGIQETGCLVKDVEEGLVDFPSLRDGEEVYLCWKLGEERIRYWHGIQEGFAGRKSLDDPCSDNLTDPTPRVQ